AIRTPHGRILRHMRQDTLVHQYGVPSVALHRARLQEVLLSALAPDTLVTGREVAGVAADGGGTVVRFADGSTVSARVAVGADGVHSAVRASLFGAEPVRDAGQISWRGVCPSAAAGGQEGGETWGRGARFGFIPISATEVYWYAVLDTTMAPPAGAEQRGTLLQTFGAWHAPIPALLEATSPAAVIRTPIGDRPPMDEWGRGPITLLGDAAHPMTPNLGQGGCQAIEDAWVLASELAVRLDAEALRAYERGRRDRTRRFVEESWRVGRLAQTPSPVVSCLRNTLMRSMPERWIAGALTRAYAFDPDATGAGR